MVHSTNQNEALDEWLKEQVARGCTLESMIEAMQTAGYALEDANNQVVRTFIAAGLLWDRPSNFMAKNNLKAQVANKVADWRVLQEKQAILLPLKPIVSLKSPRIMVFDQWLSDDECNALIQLSQAKMQDSTVVDPKTGAFVKHAERTSRGTYFEHQSNAVVVAIENRVNSMFGFAINMQEGIQILHYSIGGEYRPHYDFFPPEKEGSQAILSKSGGQRHATLIMYLNTPEEGGATDFPNLGLTILAKKGRAVYFENVDYQGKPDPKTLHAGMPVLAGEKWIATKWLREQPIF